MKVFATVVSVVSASAEGKTCHAISPQASDSWCNSNCNYSPPNCPPSLCSCDGPSPSPSPSPSPTPTPHEGVLGAYFANWAQYRQGDYKHTAADVGGLSGIADHIYFGFVYFCPPSGVEMPYWGKAPYGSCSDATEYQLMTLEHNDPQSISTLKGQGFKVMASVGGWNFPSHYFSEMVATSETRGKFIQSAKSFLSKYGFAGIDIDWEFPCSPSRDNPVKITNTKFRTVHDEGGQCPRDTTGLTALMKEMREAMPDMYISIASQAAEKNWVNMGVSKEQASYIDHYHIMNYDYSVSDVPSEQPLSPNQPLFNPPEPVVQWSINYTVQGYLALGVPPQKMMVGLAMYGHTWYSPNLDNWQVMGGPSQKQSECFGPFKETYGAKPGKGCNQCGVMMFSEIEAAACETHFDDVTQSDVAYCSQAGRDGYTEAGTWITYQSVKANDAVVDYGRSLGLAGFFTFDTSMDSIKEKYKLHKAIEARMAGPVPPAPTPVPPTPTPTPSPTPSDAFKCVNSQCVASVGGVSKGICESICGSSLV